MALLLLLAPVAARAHGILAESAEGGIGVRAFYEDGSPVALGEARLYAPGAVERPVFTGMTDRGGYFFFRPDAPGAWHVEIDDGMGHVVSHTMDAAGGAPASGSPGRPPRGAGAITGVSLIFGVFGWAAYFRARRVTTSCTSPKAS